MKKILQIVLALGTIVLTMNARAQSTNYVQIGDETTNFNVSIANLGDFSNYYENNHTQTLYLADEIGGPMTIEALQWDFAQIAPDGKNYLLNFQIRIIETTDTALATGTFYSTTNSTLVYSVDNLIPATATGWAPAIDIDDYVYTGDKNIIIDILWGDNGYYTGTKYLTNRTNGVVPRMLVGYADSETPPDYDSNSSYYSNIRLYGEASAPDGTSCDQAIDYGVPGDAAQTGSIAAYGEVWYKFTTTEAGKVRVSLCDGTDYDSKVEVWDDCGDGDYEYYNDDACGYYSEITTNELPAGTTKYVKVYGWTGQFGNYELNISMVPVPVTAYAKDTILYLDENGQASVTAAEIDSFSSANAGIASMSLSQTSFTCEDIVPPVVYATSYYGNNIFKMQYDYSSNAYSLVETIDLETLGYTKGIDINPVNNNIYIVRQDFYNKLYTLNIETGSTQLLGNLSDETQDFAIGNDGYAYVIENNGALKKYDLETMQNTVLNAKITDNTGMAGLTYDYDNDRLIYTSRKNTNSYFVYEIAMNGTANLLYTINAPDDFNGEFFVGKAIEYMGNNECLVSGPGLADYIHKINLLTGDITFTQTPNGISQLDEDYKTITEFFYNNISPGNASEVVLTVTANSGELASATSLITVLDKISPVALCKNTSISIGDDGGATLNAQTIDNGSADNTNCITYVIDKDSFGVEYAGTTQIVTLTVFDASGNSASCESEVLILDTVPPTALCSNVYVGDIDALGGEITLSTATVDNGSFDATGLKSLSLDKSEFSCSDLGENTVTLTVVDNFDNVSTCQSLVIVDDQTAPVIEAVEEITVQLAAGVCETGIAYPEVTATDGCGAQLALVSGLGAEGIFPVGSSIETWVATDAAGNTDTMSFTVTVVAAASTVHIDPVSDQQFDTEVLTYNVALSGISGEGCMLDTLIVSAEWDNHELIESADVVYDFNSTTGSLALGLQGGITGTSVISLSVSDGQGAVSSTSFTVEVVEVNAAPVLLAPVADQVVNAARELRIALSSVSGNYFSDDRDAALSLNVYETGMSDLPAWATMVGDTLVCNPLLVDTGCVEITVAATDSDGASATDVFTICVEGYVVGVSDLGVNAWEVNMYPNPSSGRVSLDLGAYRNEIEIRVMDVVGRTVQTGEFGSSDLIQLDLSGEVPGMYFIQMNLDGNLVSKKLILQK